MNLETKDLQIVVTKTVAEKDAEEPQGVIEAIVSVFGNVDLSGERIVYGAFTASLARKLPKGVWAHNWERPIAKTLAARELAPGDPLLPERLKELGGLYVKALFNLDTQDGRDAFSNIKNELFDEYSIGYRVVGRRDAGEGVTELTEIELYEWSPVMVGCNPATATLSAKAAPPPHSDAESYSLHLRGALALAEIAV